MQFLNMAKPSFTVLLLLFLSTRGFTETFLVSLPISPSLMSIPNLNVPWSNYPVTHFIWNPWDVAEISSESYKTISLVQFKLILGPINLIRNPELVGYLDWPRIHFSGQFVADVNTLNNIRCNFHNKRFTPTNLMDPFPILGKGNTGEYVEFGGSWNPDGSGHFYFINTTVKSICKSQDEECSTEDSVVGRTVREKSTAVYVDLDTDWQVASILYGLKLKIEGILEGTFQHSEIQSPTKMAGHYAGFHKSKLVDVTWLNEYYQTLFNGATELSISMSMDLYSHDTHVGRVTATIGPTNSMEPRSVSGYRILTPKMAGWENRRVAPFRINCEKHFLIIDLSLALEPDVNGHYNPESLGLMDLALIIEDGCYKSNEDDCTADYQWLTAGGTISKLLADQSWHDVYGGVLKIDLSGLYLSTTALQRLVLMWRKDESTVYAPAMVEVEQGVRIGIMERTTCKLNAKETTTITLFASSFGEPVIGANISLGIFQNSKADTDCQFGTECSLNLATDDMLDIQPSEAKTDKNGHATFTLTARELKKFPRGCGLDGQLYPLKISLDYKSLTFIDGQPPPDTVPRPTETYLGITTTAALIYSVTEIPDVPTWIDVKDIFTQYYNLYPVMWKNRIVDLGSYEGVKKSKDDLQFAMQLDPNDPRYMPVTRDLSKSKIELIEKFFENGMKYYVKPNNIDNSCDYLNLERNRDILHELLQRAITLELTTMPPYITAWLSLKTENGKNLEVADLIKSVFIEEMYHMTLASNILNAVGGAPDLISFRNIPSYPSALSFGSLYKVNSNMMATIEPMSIGLATYIFSKIEEPQMEKQSDLFQCLALILKVLEDSVDVKNGTKQRPNIVNRFMNQFYISKVKAGEAICGLPQHSFHTTWHKIQIITTFALKNLLPTDISSIGAFYGFVSFQLSLFESCLQLGNMNANKDGTETGPKTLFTGSQNDQIELPDVHVIKVHDLYTALQAVLTIVYEGEGGSKCSPYTVPNGELSHYYRFQEIVKGRKLIEVSKDLELPDCQPDICLDLGDDCAETPQKFCYIGDKVPLNFDGIWPIVSNPDVRKYEKNSVAAQLNNRFNDVYTDLLHCLHITFTGKPEQLGICITKMHDLVIEGKRAVQTKITEGEYAGKNVAPTWSYILSSMESAGLPLL